MNARSYPRSARATSSRSPMRRPPGTGRRLAGAALLLALAGAWPGAVLAQYMYLDSNGDGIHTEADQVNPADPTTFDIWLDTDSNRDGSTVVCEGGSAYPLSVYGYDFVLRAVGGAVSWSAFTNRLPTAGITLGEQSSDTEYYIACFGFPPASPPGVHRLASLTVGVQSGAPSIEIVASGPALPRPELSETSFGTECVSLEGDNSCKLGRDWSDVDGLAAGEAIPGHPPLLTQPAAMTVPVGAVAKQALAATDADGQPLTFTKTAGPGWLWIETLDPGRGTAAGEAVVAPIYTDVGTWSGSLEVTDGVSVDRKTFDIVVMPQPNRAPALAPSEKIMVVAGTIARHALFAGDADGQPVQFSRVSGPEWASVTTLYGGRGGATGGLRLAPTPHDVGLASVAVSATDGVALTERSFEIDVFAPLPVPPSTVLPWPPDVGGADVALSDLNGDGTMDLVSGHPQGSLSVSLGRGDGTFLPATHYSLGNTAYSVAVGDINGDGRLDVAGAGDISNRLVILLGNGDGTFSRGAEYAAGQIPQGLTLQDLNADGALDAVEANYGGGSVSVFLGHGDGSFGPRRDFATGSAPMSLAIADLDEDGRLDLATGNVSSHSITLLFGRGDGTFGRRTDIPTGGSTGFVAAADFNWDGIPDLAANSGPRGVRAWIGAGDGTFLAAPEVEGPYCPCDAATVDWNADGNQDVAFTDSYRSTLTVLYGAGDGTFPTRDTLGPGDVWFAVGDLNGDGYPDAAARGAIILNASSGLMAVEARVFLENSKPAVSAAPSGPDFCLYLEPVEQSFSLAQMDMASVTLLSQRTGTVDRIHAQPGGTEGDVDRNGIADLPVCFAAADLRQLFGGVKGRETVPVRLEGGLVTGQHFSAPLTLTVVGGGKPLAVLVTPNPLNPSGTVTVTTSMDGFLRVRLYDVHGRLVRTLADVPSAPAGAHEFRIEVENRRGGWIGSGVYFLRVETPEGTLRARVAVLK